jgi:hypothetical protein
MFLPCVDLVSLFRRRGLELLFRPIFRLEGHPTLVLLLVFVQRDCKGLGLDMIYQGAVGEELDVVLVTELYHLDCGS